MAILKNPTSALHTHFFAPLTGLFVKLKTTRCCPKIPDEDWLQIGVARVLEGVKTGRDFLQSMQAKLALPTVARFFEALKSKRRLALCREANTGLTHSMTQAVPDAFAAYSNLAEFDFYASDGHAHSAAVHDAQQYSASGITKKAKFATSHIYALNLRTHGLHHLAIADQITRRKEHEIRTLKRLTLDQFRLGAPKGRKVLHIYDPAIVDYEMWRKLKEGGVYVLTRQKSNASMVNCGPKRFDRADPINAGVLLDDQVGVAGTMLRHVRYRCPLKGEIYDFLTNEMTIAPGLIARIYQMRWDIEKVYDEVKNKFHEQKAWASSPTAKTMQAQFICLTHNLMVLQEHHLNTEEGVANICEIKRKAQRLEKDRAILAAKNETLPALQEGFQRLTQRSVKYIRWLRAYLYEQAPWAAVVLALRDSYAVF